MKKENFIWYDRRRTFLGLPLSFTKYALLKDKILIDTGFLSTRQEEVKLYRILDLTLKRSLFQRIFGIGTIHCCSGDKSTPEFEIKDIKKPFEVKELLSKMIEEERDEKRISSREILYTDDDIDGF